MTAQEIEIAIAQHLGWRQNLIVPNVSWGFGLGHEADMLVVSKSGYLSEIEIKVRLSDLKADRNKSHGHIWHETKALWFAIPEKLEKHIDEIPSHAGVYSIRTDEWGINRVRVVRAAQINSKAEKLTPERRLKLAELGAMRIWDLKDALFRCNDDNIKLRERFKLIADTKKED